MCVFFTTGAYAVSDEELARQEALILEYRLSLARTPADEAEARERIYLGMIGEGPDTEAAQEALWALAGLYLDDFDEPQEVKAQEVLEYFIKKYPDSPWIPQVENRLLWLYEGSSNQTRIVELYEKILQRDMPPSLRQSLALRCAQAWEAAKRPDKAQEWYTRILKEAGSNASPEVEAARARLAALKQKGR
ncbi:MAG: hypothetical protein LBQ90_05575 [Synergistaceae bacterium]|nr:hypothetical protein [Synergistaceae bacterium]